MSDIQLDDIKSGYNLGKINSNFEKIKSSINDSILHREGGNNSMGQEVDMDGNAIYNLPYAEGESSPVVLGQLRRYLDRSENLANSDVSVEDYNESKEYTVYSEWVRFDSVIYRPDSSLLPIGPEAFDSSKWIVAQITGSDNLPLTVNETNTTLEDWANSLNVSDYDSLVSKHASNPYPDGITVHVTDDGISGSFKIVKDVGHGLTSDKGLTVKLDDDYYAKRLDQSRVNLSYFGDDLDGFTSAKLLSQNIYLSRESDVVYDFSFELLDNSSGLCTSILGHGAAESIGTKISTVDEYGINALNTVDYASYASSIKDLRVFTEGAGFNCLAMRYKHFVHIENFFFYCDDDHGVKWKDTWLCKMSNGYVHSNNGHGLYLEGANHGDYFERVRFRGEGKGNACIYLGDAGTVADENAGIHINTCDFEFSNCRGLQHNSYRTTTVTAPYIEELGSVPFYLEKGKVIVNGGIVIYDGSQGGGADIRSLAQLNGGTLIFNGTHISNHSGLGIGGMLTGDTGEVIFYDCTISVPTGGTPYFPGFPLGKGNSHPQLINPCPSFGSGYHLDGGASNPTKTVDSDGRTTRWTVTTAGINEILFTINPANMDTGSLMSFIVKCKTNVGWSLRLAGGVFGTTPLTAGYPIPNTGEEDITLLALSQPKPEAGHIYVSVFKNSASVGDYIQLESMYLMSENSMKLTNDLYEPA